MNKDRKTTFSLIVLGAGQSTRFGSNKLLEPCGEVTVLDNLLMKLHTLFENEHLNKDKAELVGITLVTRQETKAGLRKDFENTTSIILNPIPEEGISHSIFLGLEASKKADVYGFLVADQLALSMDTVIKMMECYTQEGKGILCAKHKETLGNPVFFKDTYVDELRKLQGDKGGKAVLKKHLEDVAYFEIEEALELQDLDTREDWTYFMKENGKCKF